jgi:hypothetical protein
MISLNMTQEQFECVKKFASSDDAQLKAHDFKLQNLSEDGLSGHIHTREIDADFEYRAEGHALILDNEKKHGMYGLVSDDTIGSHLNAILGGLECSDTPVPDPSLNPTAPATTPVIPVKPAVQSTT